jgi:hypothetical protein
MSNTLTDIRTATGVAQFIAIQLAAKIGGPPAKAAAAYLMGEVSWTASTTDLIVKLKDGTATGDDVAQVLSKTATMLAGFGVLSGLANPSTLRVVGTAAGLLFLWENYPQIIDQLAAAGIKFSNYIFDFTHKHPYCLAVRPIVTEYIAFVTYNTYSYQETIPYDNDSDPDESGAAELAEGETKTVYVTGSYPIITYKRILKSPADPIVLDLSGNGVQTVGLNAGIQFDINGSGVKQNTGWIAPGSAFLVLDRNGNGVIDNGSELFGNGTPLYDANGNITGYAADGQTALAAQDTNHDGVINNLDANFARLQVWQDLNQDGICQPDELQTLTQSGITSINAGMTAASQTMQLLPDGNYTDQILSNGNQIAATGTYTLTDGTTHATADLNLALDPTTATFADTIPLTAAAQALPDMQGSGTVRELNQAASMQTAQWAANDELFEIRKWR